MESTNLPLQLKIKEKFDLDTKELELMKWCTQYLSPNGIFVDVGAQLGSYSMILAKHSRGVFAFEKDPIFAKIIIKNVEDNNIKNMITYHVKEYSNCFNLNIVNNHQIQLLKLEYDDLDILINISKLLLDSNFPPFLIRITKNPNVINYIKSLGYKIKELVEYQGMYFASDNPRYVKNSVINEDLNNLKNIELKEEIIDNTFNILKDTK